VAIRQDCHGEREGRCVLICRHQKVSGLWLKAPGGEKGSKKRTKHQLLKGVTCLLIDFPETTCDFAARFKKSGEAWNVALGATVHVQIEPERRSKRHAVAEKGKEYETSR